MKNIPNIALVCNTIIEIGGCGKLSTASIVSEGITPFEFFTIFLPDLEDLKVNFHSPFLQVSNIYYVRILENG